MQEEQIKVYFDGVKKLLDDKRERDIYEASDFSVVEIIGPDENQLSDVISELLNPKGRHGQGDVFIKAFLKIIAKKVDETKYENIYSRNVRVKREDSNVYTTEPQGRIDITLGFDNFGIGIENKPRPGHPPKQLERYEKLLNEKFRGNFILIYLSTDYSPPPRESIDLDRRKVLEREKKFTIFSYTIELKDWLESCYKECRAEKVRWFLRDFIDFIEENFKQLVIEREERGEKNGEQG